MLKESRIIFSSSFSDFLSARVFYAKYIVAYIFVFYVKHQMSAFSHTTVYIIYTIDCLLKLLLSFITFYVMTVVAIIYMQLCGCRSLEQWCTMT